MENKNIDKGLLSPQRFSALSVLSVDTLRLYEKKGIICPALSVKKNKNTYHYYAPPQLIIFKMVRILEEAGVPLKTIGALSKSRTPLELLPLLDTYGDILDHIIRHFTGARSVLETFRRQINKGIGVTETRIKTVYLKKARPIAMGGQNDFSNSVSYYGAFTRFYEAANETDMNLSYPVGGYFESMGTLLSNPSQPTRFFSLDEKGKERIPQGLYLVGYIRGDYGETNGLPERMAEHAKKNGLIFSGAVYNTYLFDQLCIVNPKDYLLEISASVKEIRRVPPKYMILRP